MVGLHGRVMRYLVLIEMSGSEAKVNMAMQYFACVDVSL